jgi:tetratricopeptide (TPR) repeat protein
MQKGFLALVAALAVATPLLARAQGLSRAERLLNQATMLIVDGRFYEAEPLARAAVAANPNLAEARYNLGVIYRNTGRFDQAIAEFRIARTLFRHDDIPNQTKNLYGIALAAEDKGDPQAAIAAWNDYIAFAQRYAAEQPALAIARHHLNTDRRLAAAPPQQLPPPSAATPRPRM